MDDGERFDAFVRSDGQRLKRALVAAYGPVDGSDAAQAALRYGWEHWRRVAAMENPAGYLYRVGQSEANRLRGRTGPVLIDVAREQDIEFEPGLLDALRRLTGHQRIAVLLVHGHGYRLREVADLLDISISSLRNHLHRGLDKLRNELGVEHVTN